ncbi:hypothetical protein [Tenacibaculum maritimum]|uniref:hypothetical protein n=1 Tax=Tenacibaculum maritimum TaxID=107401 RepID=UPI0010A3A80E|nr:hypothetical protein [Tenacibaculum maritimum]QCD61595.1 hypothetical protein B9C57_03100 [Tenacibaculum maritimum]QCD61610.1 hypothetical protein B9C57_03180 [Tenacibaculum maritimum]
MNIFSKIRDIIDRKKAVNEIYDDIKNLDEVLLEKRIEIFKEIVTPKFAEIGLNNWNGKYLWYSDFNENGIKHVIEYNVFKSFGGSFSFGNCFDFTPTVSGKKLINHRTDKSTKIIYYKRLEGWQKQMENNSPINPDKISTVNEQKFRQSLNKVLAENIPKLKTWFQGKKTIEENISGLLADIKNPPFEIGQRIISFEYVLGFLYKKKNDTESANYWINKHFEKSLNSESEKELINQRINN